MNPDFIEGDETAALPPPLRKGYAFPAGPFEVYEAMPRMSGRRRSLNIK